MRAREAAVKVLYEIQTQGKFSNKVLQSYSRLDMSNEDKRLLRELVYGVLENLMYIDSIIESASKVKMKKIHSMVLQILRTGVYQLLFMDRIPPSAAINEAVKLSKKYGHKGTVGYVNGILRNIDRNSEKIKLPDNPETKEALAMRYSHPDYIVEMWTEQFGFTFTRELVKSNNSTPLLNIRVNTLKTDRKELAGILESKGLKLIEGDLSPDCIKILNPENITELDEFKTGLFTIQDESSMLVVDVTDPSENDTVIDVCSAPGGKATHIAQRMINKGKIIARDLYPKKIELVLDNAKRLGIEIIEGQVHDALIFDKRYRSSADICIVDAPCSGFGLLRRKPEIKFNRRPEDIESLVDIQLKILETCSGYVKPGGKLIYSTCTLNNRENLEQVRIFLNSHPEFSLTPIKLAGDVVVSKTQEDGFIELYPHIHGTDGFFIAKMTRNSDM
ncbi:MAG: 16S rRNA (cytosine(967)-C(5))-methyltransferase RsmB [Bacillota bacterium]